MRLRRSRPSPQKPVEDVAVYTATYQVIRETRAEAEAYHHHYAVEMEDTAAVDHLTGDARICTPVRSRR